MNLPSWKTMVPSFIAGALLVTAFAPFNLYICAFISVSVILYLWSDASPKASFWLGLSYGYGLYLAGVSWIYVSLSTYGGVPLWMGLIAVVCFAGVLALFIALTGYVGAKLFNQYRLVALPFIWVIFEWAKSWVLTGFPWLDIGYTQTPSWLMTWAPVGGVYLVSFVVLVISACVTSFMLNRHRGWSKHIVPSSIVGVLLLSSLGLNYVNWSHPIGRSIEVGLVQPNTPIQLKWQPSYQTTLITKLVQLSQGLNDVAVNGAPAFSQSTELAPVDLIIWPETALPVYMQQTSPEFWKSITPQGSSILAGIMDRPNPENPDELYNAAVLTCEGQEPAVYRKSHLVPFGEYLPLRFLFKWVTNYLELPMGDLLSWQGAQTLSCGESLKIGLSICYEDAFAAEYRSSVGDATLLVNISEDAWFGDSLAPHQRKQMAQMRAAELARPLVRSANSGPSLVIDVRGQVQYSTEQFVVDAQRYSVQPYTGDSLFKRFGNWIILFSFIAIALLLFIIRRRKL